MIRNATGIILAGGESRRFGENKALKGWGRKTLIESPLDVLSTCFPHTLIVAKQPENFRFLVRPGIDVTRDLFREHHALGGLYTGLEAARTSYVFVCGCDMPLVRPSLVSALYRVLPGHDAAVPVWRGGLEPLCAFYSKNCLEPIREMIQLRNFKIQDLFGKIATLLFSEREVRQVDRQGVSFADIDTPDDYRAHALRFL